MEHLAIDLGGRKSQVCVRGADGQILEEKQWPTRQLGEYLAKRPPSRVIVETCAEGFFIADLAAKAVDLGVHDSVLIGTARVGFRGRVGNASCHLVETAADGLQRTQGYVGYEGSQSQ